MPKVKQPKDHICNSCTKRYDGTNGNGYQPCGCKKTSNITTEPTGATADLENTMNDEQNTEPESRDDAKSPVESLVMRLRNAANDCALEIGDAWNLFDEAADKLEQLQEDTIRLDFMDAFSTDIGDIHGQDAASRGVMFYAPYDGDRPPTIRDAIDAAMAKTTSA